MASEARTDRAWGALRVLPEVAIAQRTGRAVVALESSVLAQGLPVPANRDAARRMCDVVAARGAVPAITAVVGGVATCGLRDDELERFLARDGVRKVSARDLGAAIAQGADGATTVAASLVLAHGAGIDVFATGGIGGVHRGAPFDESADLIELSRIPMLVVSAGAKAILDLHATMERLETLGVPVVGYRTHELPGFLTASTGIALATSAETVAEIVWMFRARRALGQGGAMLIVQPPPAEHALSRSGMDDAVARALERSSTLGISGASLTPYLLGEIERVTEGGSVGANLALLESNADLAAQIAVALLDPGSS
ncbi:MAG: pseudouridine-5'-phosphate glycosidase [Gemmatimonadota bacterium]|nr:pseudouridine-5'-phosphate glycosidase [Gemmatimonadota bacterium]